MSVVKKAFLFIKKNGLKGVAEKLNNAESVNKIQLFEHFDFIVNEELWTNEVAQYIDDHINDFVTIENE